VKTSLIVEIEEDAKRLAAPDKERVERAALACSRMNTLAEVKKYLNTKFTGYQWFVAEGGHHMGLVSDSVSARVLIVSDR